MSQSLVKTLFASSRHPHYNSIIKLWTHYCRFAWGKEWQCNVMNCQDLPTPRTAKHIVRANFKRKGPQIEEHILLDSLSPGLSAHLAGTPMSNFLQRRPLQDGCVKFYVHFCTLVTTITHSSLKSPRPHSYLIMIQETWPSHLCPELPPWTPTIGSSDYDHPWQKGAVPFWRMPVCRFL